MSVPRKPSKRKKTRRKSEKMGLEAWPRLSRKQMSIVDLTTPLDYVQFWRTRSPAERLAHVEYLRLINYGQAAVSGQIKKVFEIVDLRSR